MIFTGWYSIPSRREKISQIFLVDHPAEDMTYWYPELDKRTGK